jgi:ankyrin repeat protein
VLRGCSDELENLWASGADIAARNGTGQTSLMLAAADGHAGLVAWLIEHGAARITLAKTNINLPAPSAGLNRD